MTNNHSHSSHFRQITSSCNPLQSHSPYFRPITKSPSPPQPFKPLSASGLRQRTAFFNVTQPQKNPVPEEFIPSPRNIKGKFSISWCRKHLRLLHPLVASGRPKQFLSQKRRLRDSNPRSLRKQLSRLPPQPLGQSVVLTPLPLTSFLFQNGTSSAPPKYLIIIIDIAMSSLIVRQFTQGRLKSLLTEYTKIIGHKSPKLIDAVIPDLSTNLFKSTEAFIEAVANLDAQFIESTATHALQKKLLRELEEMKKRNVEVKTVPVSSNLADALRKGKKEGEEEEDIKRFIISPYVIFGQQMKQRFEAAKPWENAAPVLGLNRFVVINPSEGLSWPKIKNDHIYGFHCHYQNINKGFEITENSQVTACPSREFVVTFETDSVNHEFFVSDFNYIVKNDL